MAICVVELERYFANTQLTSSFHKGLGGSKPGSFIKSPLNSGYRTMDSLNVDCSVRSGNWDIGSSTESLLCCRFSSLSYTTDPYD